jgi:two-component sensor histidine kinase
MFDRAIVTVSAASPPVSEPPTETSPAQEIARVQAEECAGQEHARPWWLRYGLALGGVALATAVRWAFTPILGPTLLPFTTYYAAVVLAEWYGRTGPAVLAILLSVLASDWLFVDPPDNLLPTQPKEWLAILTFAAVSAGLAGALEAMHRANERALAELSERRKVAQALREHSREIEDLNERLQRAMMETDHRVKNNLQTVAALLELHTDTDEMAMPVEAVRDLHQQIRSLALIHDLLSRLVKEGRGTDGLSTRAVLGELLPLIQATLSGRRITAEVADLCVTPRQATALALTINELLSNAVKHAPAGAIRLELSANGEVGRLVVEDEGPGFPPGFDPQQAANTGLDLVLTMGQGDLGGRVAFENRSEGGGRVVVTFPLLIPSAIRASGLPLPF